jgi:hypothetical protein
VISAGSAAQSAARLFSDSTMPVAPIARGAAADSGRKEPGRAEERAGFGPAVVVDIRRDARTGRPGAAEGSAQGAPEESARGSASPDQLSEEDRRTVEKLKARDREVRTHEQTHAAVGGQYAGAPSYTYQTGPDGRRYAVGGEVSIDASPEKDPAATIEKMEIVKRAALAPAEPSAQDVKVAQTAERQRAEAQRQLARQRAEEAEGGPGGGPAGAPEGAGDQGAPEGAARGAGEAGPRAAGSDGAPGPDRGRFAAASAAYGGTARLLIQGPYGAGVGAGGIGLF